MITKAAKRLSSPSPVSRLRFFAQRLRSCSNIRHVKCSEMYLNTNRNHSQAKPRLCGGENRRYMYHAVYTAHFVIWTWRVSSQLQDALSLLKISQRSSTTSTYRLVYSIIFWILFQGVEFVFLVFGSVRWFSLHFTQKHKLYFLLYDMYADIPLSSYQTL
jgi:hypothetical protein